MNTNIYWPIYKNIESEFNNLMFNIHIDDTQLNVYSSKISDLILRASAEIESISKELYKLHGGPKTSNIRYDEDAIVFLNTLWNLEQKVVIVISYNCFITKKEVRPFKKNEMRTGSTRQTYSWNNSYQNLKHDRANSLSFGNVKYLFEVTAALFILNIYYKDLIYDLEDDSTASKFDLSMGSSIYSIKLHNNTNISIDKEYEKNTDFDECIYLLLATNETYTKVQDALKKVNEETLERNRQQILNYLTAEKITDPKTIQSTTDNVIEKIKTDNMVAVAKENGINLLSALNGLRYEAILNKKQY